MAMNNEITEFELWLQSNPLPGRRRRGSPATLQGYVADLGRFAHWFNQQTGLELDPEHLTADDIQDFLDELERGGLGKPGRKPATVLRYFAAIHAYVLYLTIITDGRFPDLTVGIRLPRKGDASKRGLRRRERLALERVFNMPNKDTDLARLRLVRDKAIVFTFMYVGLRLSELVDLNISDVSVGERKGSIVVRHGKGNHRRTVAVPVKARRALREWVDVRPSLHTNSQALFVSLRNRQRLGGRSIQQMVSKAGEKAGLDDLTPHVLRHTAVRIWREKTLDDKLVAVQMGHSVATMMRYDAVDNGDLFDGADKI